MITIECNINNIFKYPKIPWNKIENIIEVSRNNKIFCYHSKKDVERDYEDGKKYFDNKFSEQYLKDIDKACEEHEKVFNLFRKTDFSALSNQDLMKYLRMITARWEFTIAYFRGNQAEGICYLVDEIKKVVSEEEESKLLIPPELDIIGLEQIEWEKLKKQDYSKERLLNHAKQFPWIVPYHFTLEEVIRTLTERYHQNEKFSDVTKEKEELKKEQENILKKHPNIKPLVIMAQKLALARSKVKSYWGGNDFYLIPLFEEISKRTGEQAGDLIKYYMIDELENLLINKINLSKEEKENRKRCFIALWKNGKAVYKSGKDAEKLEKQELGEMLNQIQVDEFKGNPANKGIAHGAVRILYANNLEMARSLRKTFQKNDILVTEMTQPNIVDIAKRAGAIVTDEGGMLSHAAIISREFKIPCIVGTTNATQILRDGDIVEVDANKGIVKIIKRAEQYK